MVSKIFILCLATSSFPDNSHHASRQKHEEGRPSSVSRKYDSWLQLAVAHARAFFCKGFLGGLLLSPRAKLEQIAKPFHHDSDMTNLRNLLRATHETA